MSKKPTNKELIAALAEARSELHTEANRVTTLALERDEARDKLVDNEELQRDRRSLQVELDDIMRRNKTLEARLAKAEGRAAAAESEHQKLTEKHASIETRVTEAIKQAKNLVIEAQQVPLTADKLAAAHRAGVAAATKLWEHETARGRPRVLALTSKNAPDIQRMIIDCAVSATIAAITE